MTRILIAALVITLPLLAQEGEKKGPDQRARRFIAQRDQNGDGKLSATELGVAQLVFAALDKNGDGFVTAGELATRRRRRPGRPAGPDALGGSRDFGARLLKIHDKDGDGKLSKEEFPQGGRLNFEKADANSDGFVDKAELGKLFRGAGRRPKDGRPQRRTREQLREIASRIMKRLDANGDNQLTPDEFPPKGKGKGKGLNLAKADRNKNGSVDLFELTLALVDVRRGPQGGRDRRGPNPRMLMKLIERMDADKDGQVTKAEWKGRPRMFANLDANKDQIVTKDEVEAALRRMREWQGRSGQALFRRMDADKDGRISKQEWKLDSAHFTKFDRNGDGFISADEVTLLRRRGGMRPDLRTGKKSAQFLQKFDRDRDGQVTKEEFAHERRFREIDADRDGILSRTEIEEAMDKRLGESDLGFFDRFDLNGDGKVTRDEFTGRATDFEARDRNNDGVIDAADGGKK